MDSPLWESIRERTTIGVQKIKERTGSIQLETDPEFQTASERFETMNKRLKMFYTNAEEILKLLPVICDTGIDFAKSLVEANEQTHGKISVSANYDVFFTNLKNVINKNLMVDHDVNIDLIEYLKTVTEHFRELENLRDQVRNTQLLLSHSKEKIKMAQRLNMKEKMEIYSKKSEIQKEELNKLNKDFISQVNELWVQRYHLLEIPLEKLVNFIYNLSIECFKLIHDFHLGIKPEELMHQFT